MAVHAAVRPEPGSAAGNIARASIERLVPALTRHEVRVRTEPRADRRSTRRPACRRRSRSPEVGVCAMNSRIRSSPTWSVSKVRQIMRAAYSAPMEAWAEPEMTMRPVALSELAARNGLSLSGPDREIVTIGAFNTRSPSVDRMLTSWRMRGLIPQFRETGIGACVVNESLAPALDGGISAGDGRRPGRGVLFPLHRNAREGMWEKLEGHRGRAHDRRRERSGPRATCSSATTAW